MNHPPSIGCPFCPDCRESYLPSEMAAAMAPLGPDPFVQARAKLFTTGFFATSLQTVVKPEPSGEPGHRRSRAKFAAA